ncbi:MAG: hypothetical protein EA425_01220 [Puniceicoccaceae bacterium]|nr:MAG: hypothetical protein EA425_01220 [Puniceicoccaceae bacterium]
MSIPPALLQIRVRESNRRRFGLWLPLFLLWPVLLLAWLLFPFLFLLGLVWPRRDQGRLLRGLVPGVSRLFCAFRGLSVDVGDRADGVRIRFL